jgi:hypothetical protein
MSSHLLSFFSAYICLQRTKAESCSKKEEVQGRIEKEVNKKTFVAVFDNGERK